MLKDYESYISSKRCVISSNPVTDRKVVVKYVVGSLIRSDQRCLCVYIRLLSERLRGPRGSESIHKSEDTR